MLESYHGTGIVEMRTMRIAMVEEEVKEVVPRRVRSARLKTNSASFIFFMNELKKFCC